MMTKDSFQKVKIGMTCEWQNFLWSSDTINGKLTERVALYIPVKINGIHEKTVMQLDLGATSSLMYEKSIKSTNHVIYDSAGYYWNLDIELGNSLMKAKKIKCSKKLGGNTKIKDYHKVGNLGFDFFIDRYLLIDYPKEKFMVCDQLPDTVNVHYFEIKDVSVNKFPILLPAKIGGKKVNIMFDTGSSLFTILTHKDNFNKLRSNETIDTSCCVQSFGKQYNIFRSTMSEEFEFLGELFLI